MRDPGPPALHSLCLLYEDTILNQESVSSWMGRGCALSECSAESGPLPGTRAAPPTRAALPTQDAPPLISPAHPGSPAYLGNRELIIEGRVVHVQLQVDALELFTAKTAREVDGDRWGDQAGGQQSITPR